MKSFLFFLCCISSILADWMDDQIDEDFREFERKGITLEMLDQTMQKRNEISFGHGLERFQVIDRKVYGPEGESKALLERISALYPVPNVDVIINPNDIIWNHWALLGPVLSTCKIKGTSRKMVHFPVEMWIDWEIFFAPEVEKACANSPWELKIPKMFWRGNNHDADNYYNQEEWTKIPRGKLCYLSQQYPHLLDAAFSSTASYLVRDEEEFRRFFPFKKASWNEYMQHKYLIDMDGYVASTPGCAWKLLANCAVFKQKSKYTLWFYRELKPWVHYIPIEHDLSDIFEKLQWAKDHDAEVKQIAENGRSFALANIMPEHLYLYCYKVLVKYASLQSLQVVEH